MKTPTLVSISTLAACQLFGQPAAIMPAFEVASVKAFPSSQGIPDDFTVSPRRSGGRVSWSTTLGLLLPYAFHLPAWRIQGLPKDPAFYHIDATFDASATETRFA